MRRVPGRAAIHQNDRLRGFVSNLETILNRIRFVTVFEDQNQTAGNIAVGLDKLVQLIKGVSANPALRAMLEKQDRFFAGSLDKSVQVLTLLQLNEHGFRLADRNLNEER